MEEPVDAGSPRASVATYLSLCRHGKFLEAAQFLDLSKEQQAKGTLLAKRLKAVLDRYAWLDLETLSPVEKGNTDDGLPASFEGIAKIPTPSGQPEPVRLYRRPGPNDGPAWVFSRNTVDHIDGWYDGLEQRWALDHLPQWLLRPGPRELLVWQWLALPILVLLAWMIGGILSKLTRGVLGRIAVRTKSSLDDAIIRRLGGPTTLLWMLGLLFAAAPLLGLYEPATEFTRNVIRGGFYFTFFWIASRLIDVWGKVVAESPWAIEHSAAKALVPIGVRLTKIVVLVIAVVALVSALGYPAASLLAGLGVGGLAVALAAQKTIENLLGAFTIGFDQPFRVGDFVKVEDFFGNVEQVGIRSTKIRTLDRTLVTIPNGRLSEMRLESYTARDRIRFACNLSLVYGTTSEQLAQVLGGIEQLFRSHPKVWPESQFVRFKELGEHALVIELQAFFMTSDFAEFQGIRQALLLEIMRIVEAAKAEFAFPTRTLHVQHG